MANSEPDEYVGELKRYCREVKVHRWRKSALASARGLFGVPPGTAAKYYDAEFGRMIQDTARQWKVDLVEFQCLHTAQYRPWIGSTPAIFREHNIDFKVWERQAQHSNRLWERLAISWIAPRLKVYEARIAPRFERCITVSDADSQHLREVAPTARIETIPSGVDTEYFLPDDTTPEKPFSIVMTGGFAWQPKQHNLRVLLSEIYPRIRARLPQATLTVVGKGAPEELRALANKIPGVTMTGAVPDVRPYVHRAALTLNYVESGGGIALKVLEAMAMCRPMLSTSLGCEGIRAQHGENVFLADGPESFAEAAVFLLQNPAVREKIARSGYRLVRQVYAWERLAEQFHDCYTSVLSETRLPIRSDH